MKREEKLDENWAKHSWNMYLHVFSCKLHNDLVRANQTFMKGSIVSIEHIMDVK